uniref:FMRFamide-19 n=1 Tax=Lucilia cuprina TaxID=7375 RepID=FAR19_LUCCU|nr:RecName: Full=FMRFamide-19; AltName: Full=LucFMRFamide-19 [Lucilia cuprina]
SANAKNDFMRF